MERPHELPSDVTAEAREHHFQQVLAGEAVQSYEALEEHDDHFLLLPDAVLGNRAGWIWTPAKDFEVLGRLEACRRALVDQGADIQGLSIVQVGVDVPMANETVQTRIEQRAVLLLYKPSAEEVRRWRERTERPLPKKMP